MAQIRCIVVTPETTVLDTTAEFVAVPLFDGELGIAANRAPMIGRLGYGELRLRTGDQITRFYVDGGFVEVAKNEISVLTGQAVPATKLDLGTLKHALDKLKDSRPTGPEELSARLRNLARNQAQVRLAQRESAR